MLHANAKSRRMLPRVGYRTHPDDPGHLDPGSSQRDHGFGDGGSGGDDIVHDEDGPGWRRADPQSARHVAPTVGSIQRLLRSAPALPGKRPSRPRPGRPGQDQLEGIKPPFQPRPGGRRNRDERGPVRREHPSQQSAQRFGSSADVPILERQQELARRSLVRNCGGERHSRDRGLGWQGRDRSHAGVTPPRTRSPTTHTPGGQRQLPSGAERTAPQSHATALAAETGSVSGA